MVSNKSTAGMTSTADTSLCVAQLVEHRTFNPGVESSNLSAETTSIEAIREMADEGSHNTRPVWVRGRQAPMAKLAVRLSLKNSCPEDVRVRFPLGAPIILIYSVVRKGGAMRSLGQCPICHREVRIICDNEKGSAKVWYRIVCADAACEVNTWSVAASSIRKAKSFWRELCSLYNKREREITDGEKEI